MKRFASVEELLDFAIKEEEASAAFYRQLAGRMDRPWMAQLLEGFAREEEGHREKLVGIKRGEVARLPMGKVADLKIAEYVVTAKPDPSMGYQEALTLAMKKEKAAFRMYSDLAEVAESDSLRETLLALAQEEAKHKLRFEVEYDETVLKEN